MVASNDGYLERSSLLFRTNASQVGFPRAGVAVQMESGQWLPFAELNHGLIWSVRSGTTQEKKRREGSEERSVEGK